MAYPSKPSTPTELLSSLPEKFEIARRSGQLFFFDSTAKDIYSDGRRFNLRSCPALLNKAKAKADALAALRKDGSPDPKRQRVINGDAEEHDKQNVAEPFKPPYVPELYVGCLEGLENEPGMSVLLNKYAVLPEHILLCPPTYQSQDLPPTPAQLALAHQILVAGTRHPTKPRRLLAFYNGGEGAGASQKWRHLQFIDIPGGRAPVEEWVQGVRFDVPNQPVIVSDLPYLHIVHPLPPVHSITYPPTPQSSSELIDYLAPALMKSLDLAFDALRVDGRRTDGGWNLLMTLDHLHLIPRTSPSFALDSPHEALELNSLGYAGMMLVRSEDEEKALLTKVEGEGGLLRVLRECGVPREWGEKALEAARAQHGMEHLL